MGRGSEKTFFFKEDKLNITNHKRSANQNLTPIRTAIIKKRKNNKYRQGYGEKGALMNCW